MLWSGSILTCVWVYWGSTWKQNVLDSNPLCCQHDCPPGVATQNPQGRQLGLVMVASRTSWESNLGKQLGPSVLGQLTRDRLPAWSLSWKIDLGWANQYLWNGSTSVVVKVKMGKRDLPYPAAPATAHHALQENRAALVAKPTSSRKVRGGMATTLILNKTFTQERTWVKTPLHTLKSKGTKYKLSYRSWWKKNQINTLFIRRSLETRAPSLLSIVLALPR